jgi:transcriptional regulator of acetoin/glycerol metabolism
VRELENLLERIFILEEGRQILVRHIPPRIMREVNGGARAPQGHQDIGTIDMADLDADDGLDFHARTRAFQRRMVARAQAEKGGISAAARALGISRHALRHQIKKLGL